MERTDFERVLKALFKFNGNSYFISARKIQSMYDYFKDDEVNSFIHLTFNTS